MITAIVPTTLAHTILIVGDDNEIETAIAAKLKSGYTLLEGPHDSRHERAAILQHATRPSTLFDCSQSELRKLRIDFAKRFF